MDNQINTIDKMIIVGGSNTAEEIPSKKKNYKNFTVIKSNFFASSHDLGIYGDLGGTKGENRIENEGQKEKTEGEKGRFAKYFCEVVNKNDTHNKVNNWNKEKKYPPYGATHDSKKNNKIVNWNKASPSGLTGFGENFP